jgi:outer membrane autotransporter protein
MTAMSSNLTGAILTDAASTSTVTLGSATTWTMTGNSNVTSLNNNGNSLISFTAPTGDPTQLASYKTLTAVNYTGAGGRMLLNTFLGGDGSPSDRLIINGGTATGTTSLSIRNTTGAGVETTGNGILVVSTINNGTTAPGAFALAGEVRGGAFDYDLFRGGLNGTDPNDWFLRSTMGGPPGTGEPPIGTIPPPGTLPPGLWPIIGPELATYGVALPTARQMGVQTLGTLHQRIGDTLTLASTDDEGTGLVHSDWARFFGERIDNHYQAFADPRATGWMGGFQGGVDVWRGAFLPGHRDAAGVYLAAANSKVDVRGLIANPAISAYVLSNTGTLDLKAISAGGYWTHYGPSGWYLDAVLQGTYYNGNAATQFAALPMTGTGFISSLEAGYPIPLSPDPRFVLEPQAQIIWQQVSFKQADDGLGPVALGKTAGLTGRLGLRGVWTIVGGDNGQVWQPYARANVWQDWGAQATTMFGVDPVPLLEQATRLEFAGGLTAGLGGGLSIYAQGGYQFAINSALTRNSIQGDLGLRTVW